MNSKQKKSEEEQKGICQKEQETALIFQKTEGVHTQEETEATRNLLEIKVIENPNYDQEGNRYLMVATFQKEGKEDRVDEAEEEISVRAFRQRKDSKDDEVERRSPWWTSREASNRAKESLEHAKMKRETSTEQPEVRIKALQ